MYQARLCKNFVIDSVHDDIIVEKSEREKENVKYKEAEDKMIQTILDERKQIKENQMSYSKEALRDVFIFLIFASGLGAIIIIMCLN